jgi:large subunit ribosomal protein L9
VKVILLGDVKSLGHKGEVVDVAEGYARNYLLPRSLAREASKGALAVLGEQKKASERREAQALTEAQSLSQRIIAARLSIPARAGSNGKLFGAVTNADVAAAINAALDVAVDKHRIEIKGQVKALGSYPVEIRLHKKVVAKATIDVVPAENR